MVSEEAYPGPDLKNWATVDSKKLEYGPRTKDAGLPSSVGFGVGGRSYFNFLACTVPCLNNGLLWAIMAQHFGLLGPPGADH